VIAPIPELRVFGTKHAYSSDYKTQQEHHNHPVNAGGRGRISSANVNSPPCFLRKGQTAQRPSYTVQQTRRARTFRQRTYAYACVPCPGDGLPDAVPPHWGPGTKFAVESARLASYRSAEVSSLHSADSAASSCGSRRVRRPCRPRGMLRCGFFGRRGSRPYLG
jgi:hypothetical protein